MSGHAHFLWEMAGNLVGCKHQRLDITSGYLIRSLLFDVVGCGFDLLGKMFVNSFLSFMRFILGLILTVMVFSSDLTLSMGGDHFGLTYTACERWRFSSIGCIGLDVNNEVILIVHLNVEMWEHQEHTHTVP